MPTRPHRVLWVSGGGEPTALLPFGAKLHHLEGSALKMSKDLNKEAVKLFEPDL